MCDVRHENVKNKQEIDRISDIFPFFFYLDTYASSIMSYISISSVNHHDRNSKGFLFLCVVAAVLFFFSFLFLYFYFFIFFLSFFFL